DVTSVDIGVWSVEGPPIASSVRLYRLEGDFVTENLDLIGQADFMLTGGLSMQVINVPVTATFRSDEIMVVEWYISSGDATKSFAFAGGNMHGQSGPSYVTAPHCE